MRTKFAAFVAFAALGTTARATAENYPPVRVDLTAVIAYAGSGDITAWGGGLAVEPKYNLTDHLSLGLRLEYTGLVSQSYDIAGLSLSMSARGVFAILAKADWYLTTSSSRPFVGLGAGYYSIGSSDLGTTGAAALRRVARYKKGRQRRSRWESTQTSVIGGRGSRLTYKKHRTLTCGT